jgi:inhibitor of KinA sporulation pathway (predicted exonuclease)
MTDKIFRKFKLKNILFVDLEMTCFNNEFENNKYFTEVIEIGIVSVDNPNSKLVDKASYLIKNEYTEISDYCTEVTTITPDLIDKEGVTLEDACKLITERFNPHNKTWMAWGCGDYNHLEKNCNRKNIINPFSDNYINFSEWVGLTRGVVRSGGLKKNLKMQNIEYNGQQHRAMVDAEATAELYLKLFRR